MTTMTATTYVIQGYRQGPPPPKSNNGQGCQRVCENASPTSQAYENCGCVMGVTTPIDSSIIIGLVIGIFLGIIYLKKILKA